MVITVGRQYGSGGREIGTMLAKQLGIAYYDDMLLKEAAEESGLCEELFLIAPYVVPFCFLSHLSRIKPDERNSLSICIWSLPV